MDSRCLGLSESRSLRFAKSRTQSLRVSESQSISDDGDDGDDDCDDDDDDDGDDAYDDYDDDAPKSTTSKELNETLFGVSRWGHSSIAVRHHRQVHVRPPPVLQLPLLLCLLRWFQG